MDALRYFRLSPYLIRAVRIAYTDAYARDRTRTGLSEPVTLDKVIFQGCTLAPFLSILGQDYMYLQVAAAVLDAGLVLR